jgi:beta-glucosidase-like glycosyl hydrolase
LDEKKAARLAGQLFVRRLPEHVESLDIESRPVANYIVFREALGESYETSRARLQEARERLSLHGIEPLFMMDEEGGRVTQISDFFPSAPSAAAVARALGPDEAREAYGYISGFLAGLGIDINLAPCVDVNTEPLNPIIGTRSFGRTREDVDLYARAMIEGAAGRVRSVSKHFPGHGMTTEDSHLAMPRVTTPLNVLEGIHIPPFGDSIRAGAGAVMVSHCLYMALQDDPLPASLSGRVVRDLLRSKLGFDGPVITDSLDMEAVTLNTAVEEVPPAALGAGVDLLLYTSNSERFRRAFDSLASAIAAGRVDPGRLKESLTRRQSLHHRLRTRPQAENPEARRRYFELRDRTLAGAVVTEDPWNALPLTGGAVALVTTNPGLSGFAPGQTGRMREVSQPGEAAGASLVLWLLEPLRLPHSLEILRGMIESARVSVLVTSCPSIRDVLAGCTATITTDDTSPASQTAILHRLLGKT